MLTLFVIPSHNSEALVDPYRAMRSFGCHVTKWYCLYFGTARTTPVYTPWYAVIYDDEFIDDFLRLSLDAIMDATHIDVFTLMKKDGERVTQAPRIFQKHIWLSENGLLPENKEARFERILNGWVLNASGQSQQ